MQTVLGCTQDTSAEAMRHILDLPCMEERHKIAQVKAYQSRLKRGTEWMTQAAATISQSCSVEDVKKGREWVMVDDPHKRFTAVIPKGMSGMA